MRGSIQQKPELLERSIAAACYLSCGLVGLIYILFSGKSANSSFFRFHFLQSIVLGVLSYLLDWVQTIVKDILTGIFGLIFSMFAPAAGIIGFLNGAVGLIFFVITKLAFLLLFYGCIFALLGKYAEIPGISRLVYRQLRN